MEKSRRFGGFLLMVVACVLLPMSAAVGQTLRWEDQAFSIQLGSAELTYEKRIFEPGLDEVICMRCKHYVEARLGVDEQDLDGVDLDITQLIFGYRYYAYVQVKEGSNGLSQDGNWAGYVGVGLGRYDLDVLGPRTGFNARVGIDRKVTEACTKDGELKRWFLDWELSSTYHRVELPQEDLDYWSVQTGPRFIFPNKRSRERAKRLGCPRSDASSAKNVNRG